MIMPSQKHIPGRLKELWFSRKFEKIYKLYSDSSGGWIIRKEKDKCAEGGTRTRIAYATRL
jgi:hypothetical protein